MIMQFSMALIASLSFAVLFSVQKKELFICGLTGAFGWALYYFIFTLEPSQLLATFVAALLITLLSRIFSILRKVPVTIFLIPGIIPLVPGALIYYTMYYILSGDTSLAIRNGIETFEVSGMIALSIIIILSLPSFFFKIFKREKKNLPHV